MCYTISNCVMMYMLFLFNLPTTNEVTYVTYSVCISIGGGVTGGGLLPTGLNRLVYNRLYVLGWFMCDGVVCALGLCVMGWPMAGGCV